MGTLFTVTALFVIVIAAGGYYLYTRTRSDTALFTPRVRRLGFIERTHLDGGRKLLLVRRDDVEHLILIGGPIDLIVETGIRPERLANGAAAEESFTDVVQSYSDAAGTWQRPDITLPPAKAGSAAGPDPSLSLDAKANSDTKENGEGMLELCAHHEAKTVQ